jgi:hypothetical protein
VAAREPHPWLMPLHRRIGVMVLALGWMAFEGYYELGGMWFWLAVGVVVYGLWDMFLSGSYPLRSGQS